MSQQANIGNPLDISFIRNQMQNSYPRSFQYLRQEDANEFLMNYLEALNIEYRGGKQLKVACCRVTLYYSSTDGL